MSTLIVLLRARGPFQRPTAPAFDARGRLHLSDTGNERVEVSRVS